MLPDYVYKMLEENGNTVLSVDVYEKYGEKAILNHLAFKGYVCRILVHRDKDYRICQSNDKSIILELIEKKPYEYKPLVFR